VQPPPAVTPNNVQPLPAPVANTSQAPPQTPTATNRVPAYTTITRPQLSTRSACLLKTAIATVSAGPYSTEGNILLDEGAQHSSGPR